MSEEIKEERLEVEKGEIHFHEKSHRNQKTDFYIEIALFLILGVLLGIALKTEATKRVSIGYDDYKMKIVRNTYDLNKAQLELTKKRAEEEAKQAESGQAQNGEVQGQLIEEVGGSCSN